MNKIKAFKNIAKVYLALILLVMAVVCPMWNYKFRNRIGQVNRVPSWTRFITSQFILKLVRNMT